MSDGTAPVSEQTRHDLSERLVTRRTEFFWLGLAMAIVGVLAIIFPFLATLAAAIMIGWLLVLAGLVSLGRSFSVQGTAAFFGTILLSLLYLGLGIYFLTHPAVSIIVLTMTLAALFMIDGAVQLSFAFDMRRHGGWVWLLISGLVSIGAGLLIAAGLPETSLFALGLLVGISFLATGLSFMMATQSAPAPTTT